MAMEAPGTALHYSCSQNRSQSSLHQTIYAILIRSRNCCSIVELLTKLMLRTVMPFALLDPILSAADGFEIVTRFWDQSAVAVAVAPTMVTAACPIVTASVYVPARTVTVGIPLICAAVTAALMAVNWPEPSCATVIAVFEPVDV